jgi:hypothetical protein
MSLPNIQNAGVNRDGVSDARPSPVRTPQAPEAATATAEVPPLNRTKKSSKARAEKFILHHLDLYGLKVEERHPRTGDIMSASCRFCVVFGREHSSKAKSGQRPHPSTIKRFKHPSTVARLVNSHSRTRCSAWRTCACFARPPNLERPT